MGTKKSKKKKQKKVDNGTDHKTNTWRYSTEQFDKSIVFIASGAFIVSFAFVKELVPKLDAAMQKDKLIGSWYIFAAVIFISLVNHFVSCLANRWDIETSDSPEKRCTGRFWNLAIRLMNITMILGILAGAILLIQFINLNI